VNDKGIECLDKKAGSFSCECPGKKIIKSEKFWKVGKFLYVIVSLKRKLFLLVNSMYNDKMENTRMLF